MNTIQQGDALIYKDSEFLDFDNTIFVENTEDTPNGTLVTLSNGQTMFSIEVNKKFRKATQGEVNRSNIMSKELFAKGGLSKMKRYEDGGSADDFDLGSIISDFGLEDIIDDLEKKASQPKKKRIVSKKAAKEEKIFGDFIFADDDPSRINYGLRDVAYKFITAQNKKEANTPEETKLLLLLKQWVDSVQESDNIAASKPLLIKLKEQYPLFFAPEYPIGTIMFRGLQRVNTNMVEELSKMELSDFVLYKDNPNDNSYFQNAKNRYVLFKKPISYTPSKPVQSWTQNIEKAKYFYGQGMLITKQDNDFFINENTLEKIYGSDESENIHIGKKFDNNIYLALNFDFFSKQILPSLIEKESSKEPFVEATEKLKFAYGGNTNSKMKKIKRGGITYGKSHAAGGIPVKNESTGDMLEVEGGEGIVNKRSMASDKKVKLNGKEMTICEAVSQLNQLEGGVQFSCDDVSDRQFIEAMAKGGELERGTRTEQEHIQVLRDLYAKRITPKQASKRIAKDHLKEDSRYYSKLSKMEGKMEDGGKMFDRETDDLLSDIHIKYAKGGSVDTTNIGDYANEFASRKNKFLKANDEYQLLVTQGLDVKENKKLPKDEKDQLLEELRKKANEAKSSAEEERKEFVDMREVKSPFYAPQLADGGTIISKANKKAIDKGVSGKYKLKLKNSRFPQKGVDVFLDIDSQSMLGFLSFSIGTRNIYKANWKGIIDDIMVKHLTFSPLNYQLLLGKKLKSLEVSIRFNFRMSFEGYEQVAMEVLKALTSYTYYEKVILDKDKNTSPYIVVDATTNPNVPTNPTSTTKTEKEMEDEIMRWTAEKVEQRKDVNTMKYQFSHLLRYILYNQNGGTRKDFDELIELAKQAIVFGNESAKLEKNGIPIDSFVMKLVIQKYIDLSDQIEEKIMLFVQYKSDVENELTRIAAHIPYIAELDTFDKDYIIKIK